MPLQCDPTVIYALEQVGKYNGSLTERIFLRFADTTRTSTEGLPPGPIAQSGEVALRAALSPAQTDYLYFVANTQGGQPCNNR